MTKAIRTVFFTTLAIIAAAGVAVLTLMAVVVGLAFAPFRAWKRHNSECVSAETQSWDHASTAVAVR